jgi:two-component system LytT family response regulator
MLKILIVDDEQPIRNMISSILLMSDFNLEIVGQADSVSSGIKQIKELKPNLVLLDIKLPDGTGFDILNQVPQLNFSVIFITAFEEYAIKAFKCSALDYILKPINIDELYAAIEKSKEQIANKNINQKLNIFLENLNSSSIEDKKIVLKTQESIHIVKVTHIIRCESYHNYTEFFLRNNKKLLVSKTLKEYDKILSNFGFFRVHQSHLININNINSFEKTDGGYLVLTDGSQVPVSKRKREELMQLFETM